VSERGEAGRTGYRPAALVLSADLRDQLAKHAEIAYPGEACGALLGRHDGLDLPAVTRAIPLPNSDPSRGEGYQIGAADLGLLPSDEGCRQELLVGFYHSHPDRPPRPSERDLRNGVPGLLYVAVSVRSGRAGSRSAWIVNSATPANADSLSQEGTCRN